MKMHPEMDALRDAAVATFRDWWTVRKTAYRTRVARGDLNS